MPAGAAHKRRSWIDSTEKQIVLRSSERMLGIGLRPARRLTIPASASESSREIIDDAGRSVRVLTTISRVFAADQPGPGTRRGQIIAPQYRDLPVIGRLNTTHAGYGLRAGAQANIAYGHVAEPFKSLADRAQQQANVALCGLIDVALEETPDAYRPLGNLPNRLIGIPLLLSIPSLESAPNPIGLEVFRFYCDFHHINFNHQQLAISLDPSHLR